VSRSPAVIDDEGRSMTGGGRGRAGAAAWAADRVGGRARLRVVVLLAAVLGLQGADTGTVGSMAVPLSRAFGIGNFRVGLIVTVTTIIGALATLPAGVLVDRVARVHLLAASVGVWTAAMVASALSGSYPPLLLSQLALGVVIALASPAVTSLSGDYFPPAERARIFGFILFGELAGTGLGIVVSGSLSAISWRLPSLVLAAGSLGLAVALWRLLPEPARGGASRLPAGADSFTDAASESVPDPSDRASAQPGAAGHDRAPRLSLLQAARQILAVRTNVALIASSALGYFFLQGLETFVTEYFRGRYGLGQATASLLVVVVGAGALVGVLSGGRIADRLMRAGRVSGRPLVAGVGFLGAAALLLPAFLVPTAIIGIPLLFAGAAFYAATSPPLDAARLDVVAPEMWGRAEAVRSLFRRLFESAAPATFGIVSVWFGTARSSSGGSAAESGGMSLSHGVPLAHTFAVMLLPLLISGLLLLLVATRTYPGDRSAAQP